MQTPSSIADLPVELQRLVEAAVQARSHAHAPYSRFAVGAAIRTPAGVVYPGSNVENSSYGATMCAERVAMFSAMAAGERHFHAIALVADLPTPLTPCGMCRQVLADLAPDLQVVMANLAGDAAVSTIGELLPSAFVLKAP